MVGFALPKLRWLVLGAMAAGGWAMLQEPPKREHWERRTGLEDAGERTGPRVKRVETVAVTAPPAPKTAPPAPVALASPLAASNAAAPTVKTMLRPAARLFATEKVRMRREPGLGGSVVAMLSAAQPVTVVGEKGEWRKVSTSSGSGWVHSDYLAASAVPPKKDTLITAAVPRPKVGVGPDKSPAGNVDQRMGTSSLAITTARLQDPAAPVKPLSAKTASSSSAWDALRPARPPQSGDCQCPYDVMLSGKQCGDHSAYGRTGGSVACYF